MKIFFAVNTSLTLDVENTRVKGMLANARVPGPYSCAQVLGSYKNQPEVSYMVTHHGNTPGWFADSIMKIARANNQECVLQVFDTKEDLNGDAYLVYPLENGKVRSEKIGRFQEISKEEALADGNYTIINNTYYGVK